MKSKLLVALCGLLLLPLVLSVPRALAHEGEEHSTVAESRQHEEVKTRVETRLNDAKKRVCENRSKNIEAIMARSVKRAENHLKLFGTIADRVKAFYEKRGVTVANYDTLVAAIDNAESDAEAAIADMKAAASFECDSDDPKGEVEAFKDAHKTVLEKLHAYRTAVKNLIVGVRGASEESAR